jgi:hypothetical protein
VAHDLIALRREDSNGRTVAAAIFLRRLVLKRLGIKARTRIKFSGFNRIEVWIEVGFVVAPNKIGMNQDRVR